MTLAEQLAAAKPAPRAPRKTTRVTENSDYVAMMQRMIRGLEERAIADPAMLAQVLELQHRFDEIVNVVIATSADTFKVNPYAAPSMAECAKVLGIAVPTASARRKVGMRIIADRLAAKGVASLSMAAREREARIQAEKRAAEAMPEYTARRAHLRVVA
jgi:hypothetical protein